MAREINGLDHLMYPESRAVRDSTSSGLDVNDVNNQRRIIAELLGNVSPVIAGQLDPYSMSDKTVKWLAKKSSLGGVSFQLEELAHLNVNFVITNTGNKNYNKNQVMTQMVMKRYPNGNPNSDRNVRRYLASIGVLNEQLRNLDDKWLAVKYDNAGTYRGISGVTQ